VLDITLTLLTQKLHCFQCGRVSLGEPIQFRPRCVVVLREVVQIMRNVIDKARNVDYFAAELHSCRGVRQRILDVSRPVTRLPGSNRCRRGCRNCGSLMLGGRGLN
jgi:hypothetical protein